MAGLYLLINTVTDVIFRTISGYVAMIFCLIAVIQRLLLGDYAWIGMALGTVPGILLLAAAWITREAIGYGDGIVLAVYGSMCGVGRTMSVMMIGFFFAAIYAVGLLLLRRAGKKDSIAFVPFLLIGHLCTI